MSLKISKISKNGFEIFQKFNEIYESFKIENFIPHVTSTLETDRNSVSVTAPKLAIFLVSVTAKINVVSAAISVKAVAGKNGFGRSHKHISGVTDTFSDVLTGSQSPTL